MSEERPFFAESNIRSPGKLRYPYRDTPSGQYCFHEAHYISSPGGFLLLCLITASAYGASLVHAPRLLSFLLYLGEPRIQISGWQTTACGDRHTLSSTVQEQQEGRRRPQNPPIFISSLCLSLSSSSSFVSPLSVSQPCCRRRIKRTPANRLFVTVCFPLSARSRFGFGFVCLPATVVDETKPSDIDSPSSNKEVLLLCGSCTLEAIWRANETCSWDWRSFLLICFRLR